MSFWSAVKHAFAVTPPREEPTTQQAAVVERVCREIVRRELVTPAILVLETSQPLSYLTAQSLHFFQPILTTVLNPAEYQAFAEFLERRDACDRMIQRLHEISTSGFSPAHSDPKSNSTASPEASAS